MPPVPPQPAAPAPPAQAGQQELSLPARRLQLITALLLSATTEEALAEAREKVAIINDMSDEEFQQALEDAEGEEGEESPAGQQYARGGKKGKDGAKADSHDYRNLAWFMIDLCNALVEHDKQPDEVFLQLLDDDLQDTGWQIEEDEVGRWYVAESPPDDDDEEDEEDEDDVEVPRQHARDFFLAVFYKATRSPKGGMFISGKHYPGGQFIPAAEVARASPQEKAELQKSADTNRAVAGERKKTRTDPVAEAWEPSQRELSFLESVLRALQAVHDTQDAVVDRLKDLVSELPRGRGKDLATLHHWLGWLFAHAGDEPEAEEQEERAEQFRRLSRAVADDYGSDEVLTGHEVEAMGLQCPSDAVEARRSALAYRRAGMCVPVEVLEMLTDQ